MWNPSVLKRTKGFLERRLQQEMKRSRRVLKDFIFISWEGLKISEAFQAQTWFLLVWIWWRWTEISCEVTAVVIRSETPPLTPGGSQLIGSFGRPASCSANKIINKLVLWKSSSKKRTRRKNCFHALSARITKLKLKPSNVSSSLDSDALGWKRPTQQNFTLFCFQRRKPFSSWIQNSFWFIFPFYLSLNVTNVLYRDGFSASPCPSCLVASDSPVVVKPRPSDTRPGGGLACGRSLCSASWKAAAASVLWRVTCGVLTCWALVPPAVLRLLWPGSVSTWSPLE